MLVVLKGYFNEVLDPYQDKEGKNVPQISVISGNEIVKIAGVDGSNLKKFDEIELKCQVSVTKYGLYVRAVK
jgi:hypothetical protein